MRAPLHLEAGPRSARPVQWHLLTGEYPPQVGGVSDYTRAVAEGLVARGESVTVWAPGRAPQPPTDAGPRVRRLAQGFTREGLAELAHTLQHGPRPARLLVQYVPHAFSRFGLNVPLAAWLASLREVELWMMFHEVAVPWSWGLGGLQAGVQRAMGALLAWRAARILVSTPAWAGLLHPRRAGVVPEWLPVPANICGPVSAAACEAVRGRVPGEAGAPLVGHFGTYGEVTTALLRPTLQRMVRSHPTVRLLLLGRGSRAFHARLLRDVPGLAGRSAALGGLPPEELAPALAACDVLLQPYQDGVTTRRGTTMAALALGRPVVTNLGPMSEPVWQHTGAVQLARAPAAAALAEALLALLASPAAERARRAEAARQLYAERFELRHTLDRLLSPPGATT